jgi:hypothetical protein
MIEFLAWLEQTPPSVFMREDFYAYFVALIGHAWGMALLVGGGLAIALRVLTGGADQLGPWRKALPVMWLGAALAAVSGLALLAGYPAKALTNWIFAVKFASLIAAALLTGRLLRGQGSKPTATLAIALWLGGVAAGKLLLYTYAMLTTAEVLG